MTHAAIVRELNTERRAFDDAVILRTAKIEREAVYTIAFDWVRLVDSRLESGYHLRDANGRLRAAETGRLGR